MPREDQASAKVTVPAPLEYLKGLYTFVATLALQEAVQQVITSPPDVTFRWHTLPLVVAFLFILVPFYHGALRHLDELYGAEADASQPRGIMMLDFSLLFIEAALLFALARLIAAPHSFGWALAVLLGVDVIWAILITTLTRQELLHESNWVRVNSVTLPCLIGLVWLGQGFPWFLGALAALAVLRTVVDYWLSWRYYFP